MSEANGKSRNLEHCVPPYCVQRLSTAVLEIVYFFKNHLPVHWSGSALVLALDWLGIAIETSTRGRIAKRNEKYTQIPRYGGSGFVQNGTVTVSGASFYVVARVG